MKKLLVGLMALHAVDSEAIKLTDYRPYKFEVLFTNPVCETYQYKSPVITHSGKTVTSKPDDVYCKPADEAASVSRKNAPQYRLKEWIEAPDTKEIYLAYLSFSSKAITDSLCKAVKNGVKITVILDSGEEPFKPNKNAESLKKCGPSHLVNTYYRGETGGLGYAHNKIMLVNPGSSTTKVVFSSGNLSSGTSTNHENWNFITTSGKSYFAQAHKCVMDGMIQAGDTKGRFRDFMTSCRSQIKAEPESDITVFFSPVDGRSALDAINRTGQASTLIEGMSHRFSGDVARQFERFLDQGKTVRFILDDDIYWSKTLKKAVGRNMSVEAFKIYNDLISKGMKTRFLETNQNVFQLQHNKLIVFSDNTGAKSVFSGAGNFTSAAFNKNFENFYLITIPGVVKAYKTQYNKYFNEMATAEEDMPRTYELP